MFILESPNVIESMYIFQHNWFLLVVFRSSLLTHDCTACWKIYLSSLDQLFIRVLLCCTLFLIFLLIFLLRVLQLLTHQFIIEFLHLVRIILQACGGWQGHTKSVYADSHMCAAQCAKVGYIDTQNTNSLKLYLKQLRVL